MKKKTDSTKYEMGIKIVEIIKSLVDKEGDDKSTVILDHAEEELRKSFEYTSEEFCDVLNLLSLDNRIGVLLVYSPCHNCNEAEDNRSNKVFLVSGK